MLLIRQKKCYSDSPGQLACHYGTECQQKPYACTGTQKKYKIIHLCHRNAPRAA